MSRRLGAIVAILGGAVPLAALDTLTGTLGPEAEATELRWVDGDGE